MYVYIYIYIYIRTCSSFVTQHTPYLGPKFKETKTHIFLSHKLLEESQNKMIRTQKGENLFLEILGESSSSPLYLISCCYYYY